jgi:transposase-like protein/predicted transcriptional regulator
MLRKYEDREWVTCTSHGYETTPRGTLVAEEVQHLVDRLETKRELNEISRWFPLEFDVTDDIFDNAVLSPQNPNKPYQPNPRFAELVESADSYRGIDIVSLKPDNVKRLFRNIAAGMKTEIIYPFSVLEDMLSRSPELASKAIESGNFTMFAYEEPYEDLSGGFALIDDRLVTCCRDYETGLPRTIVDTTAPEAVDWATSIYESFRHEAHLITDPLSQFPSIQLETEGSLNEGATPNVALPKRETCYEQLRLARAGESIVCIYCDSENVIRKGKSGKGAQRYRCKDCKSFFNDLTNTVFEHHKFPLEEMFYIIRAMRSRSAAQIARDLGRDNESVQNFVEEVRARDKQMLKQIGGAADLPVTAGDT